VKNEGKEITEKLWRIGSRKTLKWGTVKANWLKERDRGKPQSIQLNIVACHTYPDKFKRYSVTAPSLLVFVVIVPKPDLVIGSATLQVCVCTHGSC